MRVTQHSGRTHRNGQTYSTKHNDRNFKTEADNIDSERTAENTEWTWCQDNFPSLTFDEAELKFYEKFYQKQLDSTNEKYIKGRHKEKVSTMDAWRKQKKHAPEEVIIQIGKLGEKPDIELFRKCFNQYLKELNKWNSEHGNCMHILDWALHQDEMGAPHVHLRRVWDFYNSETNQLELGQEKALEVAGVKLPKQEEAPGHYNNRKMTFDADMRIVWQNIAKENGLEIETTPLPKNKVGMSLDQKIRQNEEERAHLLEVAESEKLKTEQEKIDFEQKKKTDLESIKTQKESIDSRQNELENAIVKFNDEYKEADLHFQELKKINDENQAAIQKFNEQFEEKNRKIAEWEIAEKTIEAIQPEEWTMKVYNNAKIHRDTKRFLKDIADGVKGFIAGVKKSYDKLIHGHRRYYEKNGKSVCEYSYGIQDYTEMLLDTPIDDIQKAIDECRSKNIKTFREASQKENLTFFEKHFKRAKEIKREIERTIERDRNRGWSR